MGIDFFTLIAQLINLVLLIWLLKRFLYRPIVQTIEQRQALISNEFEKAKQAKEKAIQEEQLYQKQLEDFDKKRNKMFADAQKEASDLKEKITKETKEAIHLSRKNWQNGLLQEKQSFNINLQHSIVENFQLFVADAMKDIADVSFMDLIVLKFQEKLKKLTRSDLLLFIEEAKKTKQIVVSTSAKLENSKKEELKDFFKQLFSLQELDKIKFKFVVDDGLICGISIQAGEQKTSWSIQGYLEEFKNNTNAAFEALLQTDV